MNRQEFDRKVNLLLEWQVKESNNTTNHKKSIEHHESSMRLGIKPRDQQCQICHQIVKSQTYIIEYRPDGFTTTCMSSDSNCPKKRTRGRWKAKYRIAGLKP